MLSQVVKGFETQSSSLLCTILLCKSKRANVSKNKSGAHVLLLLQAQLLLNPLLLLFSFRTVPTHLCRPWDRRRLLESAISRVLLDTFLPVVAEVAVMDTTTPANVTGPRCRHRTPLSITRAVLVVSTDLEVAVSKSTLAMEPVVSSLYVDEGVPLTHCGTLQQEVGRGAVV